MFLGNHAVSPECTLFNQPELARKGTWKKLEKFDKKLFFTVSYCFANSAKVYKKYSYDALKPQMLLKARIKIGRVGKACKRSKEIDNEVPV